ncbi:MULTISPECIES: hypothetical protein [Halorussus]|uniref:hypothetical protein n=1 Tax=Halorussus TaxID=1070314 RepID=UPI00209F56A2|nr:hypothetical protein [Halorussus vallis]USZ77565.1 hypothetical protein NGM07_09565 [Halorussus vallis]
MEKNRVDLYTCDSKIKSEKNDPEGLGVSLPFNAEEVLKCQEGDDMFVVLNEEEAVGEQISHIQVTKLPEGVSSDHPQSYELRVMDGDHFIRFPKEWPKPDNDKLGFDVESGSELVVEVSKESTAIRVYRKEDYVFRNQKLVKNNRSPFFRFIPALLGLEGNEIPDLSGRYDGDLFQFVLFDAHHPVFRRQSEKQFQENDIPSSDLFFQVKENGQLPRQNADLEVWWDPSGGDETGFDPSIKLYDAENCTETSVILPKQGYFLVKSTTQHGTLETWLARSSSERFQQSKGWERRVGESWYGFFPENSDGENGFRLYVPAKTMD